MIVVILENDESIKFDMLDEKHISSDGSLVPNVNNNILSMEDIISMGNSLPLDVPQSDPRFHDISPGDMVKMITTCGYGSVRYLIAVLVTVLVVSLDQCGSSVICWWSDGSKLGTQIGLGLTVMMSVIYILRSLEKLSKKANCCGCESSYIKRKQNRDQAMKTRENEIRFEVDVTDLLGEDRQP